MDLRRNMSIAELKKMNKEKAKNKSKTP